MEETKKFRYYDLIMATFVTVLLCSNLIGVHKVTHIQLPVYGEFIFGAGVLFFPISYLFGDVLTEVYGYARSRKVIWAGFGALIFASLMAAVVRGGGSRGPFLFNAMHQVGEMDRRNALLLQIRQCKIIRFTLEPS